MQVNRFFLTILFTLFIQLNISQSRLENLFKSNVIVLPKTTVDSLKLNNSYNLYSYIFRKMNINVIFSLLYRSIYSVNITDPKSKKKVAAFSLNNFNKKFFDINNKLTPNQMLTNEFFRFFVRKMLKKKIYNQSNYSVILLDDFFCTFKEKPTLENVWTHVKRQLTPEQLEKPNLIIAVPYRVHGLNEHVSIIMIGLRKIKKYYYDRSAYELTFIVSLDTATNSEFETMFFSGKYFAENLKSIPYLNALSGFNDQGQELIESLQDKSNVLMIGDYIKSETDPKAENYNIINLDDDFDIVIHNHFYDENTKNNIRLFLSKQFGKSSCYSAAYRNIFYFLNLVNKGKINEHIYETSDISIFQTISINTDMLFFSNFVSYLNELVSKKIFQFTDNEKKTFENRYKTQIAKIIKKRFNLISQYRKTNRLNIDTHRSVLKFFFSDISYTTRNYVSILIHDDEITILLLQPRQILNESQKNTMFMLDIVGFLINYLVGEFNIITNSSTNLRKISDKKTDITLDNNKYVGLRELKLKTNQSKINLYIFNFEEVPQEDCNLFKKIDGEYFFLKKLGLDKQEHKELFGLISILKFNLEEFYFFSTITPGTFFRKLSAQKEEKNFLTKLKTSKLRISVNTSNLNKPLAYNEADDLFWHIMYYLSHEYSRQYDKLSKTQLKKLFGPRIKKNTLKKKKK